MDAILFFKMGKFYELFHGDAVIGVNELNIMYMKGDETKPAHAGFPEQSFDKYSKLLIEKGYKVMRIEQTETPAMMEERCQRTGKRGKFEKVVKREICQVITKGTRMLGIMESVFHSAQNQYLLAIFQVETDSPLSLKTSIFGVCFIDVTIGRLHLGQFEDDHNLSKLNILLAHHKPTEVLFMRNHLNQEAYRALLRTGALLTPLKPIKEFWPIKRALSTLKTHHIFSDESDKFEWPSLIVDMFDGSPDADSILALEPKDEYKYALECFGAIVYYLHSQLIAGQVLKCAIFELYRTPLGSNSPEQLDSVQSIQMAPMIMDHIALKNLEIFENSSGTAVATLFESINNCKTHFGQRMLRNWICSPLRDVEQINNRLDAVEALVSNNNTSLMNEITHMLQQTPDLERLLSKIKNQCFKSEGDTRAKMFDGDQYSKAKIAAFLNLINNFKRLRRFITSVSGAVARCNSTVLKRLLTLTDNDGLFPDYEATLEYFERSFDHDEAKRTGRIIPSPGVDREYDQCQANISAVNGKLEEYLDEQRDLLGCRKLDYFGSGKNRFQIEVPESYCKNVPPEYRIETTRKGFKRYYTPTIDKLFQLLTTHEEELKRILDEIMSRIFEQFTRKMKLWSMAIECVAILDVLQSIASFVRSLKASDVDICRPKFVESDGKPLIDYVNGRHPALLKVNANYIPNNLRLDDKLTLLSGANMGGKSTLMRQTALLVILAQIGSYVPATSLTLTPVDRIFSRLGASDSLLEGESTFYTELVEASAMMRYATCDSLLILDELGRGTSTYDGTAIAYSVIKEIGFNIKCRCLFSTHYHSLVRDFMNEPQIRLAHMACKIERNSEDNIDLNPLKENITFLYKIAEGPVARSYGFNVAKLAGISDMVINCAFDKAKEIETGCKVLNYIQSNGQDSKACDKQALKLQVLESLKIQ